METNHSSSTIYLMFSSFVFMASGYLISVLLGRQLGPIDYGIYGVVISLMTTVNIVQSSGLPQTLTKFLASNKAEPNQLLKASILIQIASTAFLTVIFLFLAKPLASLLGDISLTPYLRTAAFVLPFYAIFSLYIAYYNGLHDFKRQARIYIAYSVAKFAAVVGLVYAFHIYGAIYGFILSPLVALFFGFRYPQRSKVPKELHRSLIIFSLPLVGYAILSTLQLSIDLLFVKGLSVEKELVGLYTAGQNIARIPFYALSAFALMLFPIVTKSIHTEEPAQTSQKINRILRNLFLLLFPATVLISLTSRELLGLLYSNEYIQAAPSLSLLVVGLAFLTVLNALTYVLVGADRPVAAMALSGLGVVVTSVVCLLLIPSLGLLGAAWGTTVGAAVTAIIALFMLSRRFPGMVPWASTARVIAASISIWLIYLLVKNYFVSTYLLPVLYIILTSIYVIILFLTRELNRADLSVIRSLLNLPKKND